MLMLLLRTSFSKGIALSRNIADVVIAYFVYRRYSSQSESKPVLQSLQYKMKVFQVFTANTNPLRLQTLSQWKSLVKAGSHCTNPTATRQWKPSPVADGSVKCRSNFAPTQLSVLTAIPQPALFVIIPYLSNTFDFRSGYGVGEYRRKGVRRGSTRLPSTHLQPQFYVLDQ